MKKLLPLLLLMPLLCLSAVAQQANVHPKSVDPSWLHRYVPSLPYRTVDLTTPTCRYKPIFGVGDPDAPPEDAPVDFNVTPVTIARYGELTVDPNGECKTVTYPREEQIYVILNGSGTLHYGDDTAPVKKNDFMYLPPTLAHTLSNSSAQPLRLVVMGFKIPKDMEIGAPPELQIANMDNVDEKVLGWHGPSVLYKLLMGRKSSKRDTIDSSYMVGSLFSMNFAPGGTNWAGHSYMEEMIYLVIDGHGEMAAGSGMDGVQGLHPVKAGDAYLFRENTTAGFTNSKTGHAHVLAVLAFMPARPMR